MVYRWIPEQTFRIPASYLGRRYAWVILGVWAFAMGPAAIGQANVKVAAVLAAWLTLPLLVVYPFLRVRVWVTLSGAGIQGRTWLGGRLTLISWAEPVEVSLHIPRRGYSDGIRVNLFNGRGRPRLFHSLYIPNAILRDAAFRAALVRAAPADHPLLTWCVDLDGHERLLSSHARNRR